MAEWLTHITPDTAYQEMLERPSAFNPTPEHMAAGDFEISPVGTPSDRSKNMRHRIRYGNGDTYEVEWPIYQPVKLEESQTMPLGSSTREAIPHNERDIVPLDRFDYFWEPQASALAARRLMEDGRVGINRAFSYASHKGIFNDPRNFIQYTSRVFEYSLKNGMPATAFAVAKTAFTGVVPVRGISLRCEGLLHWLDENVTHVIEPGISQALYNAHSGRVGATQGDILRLDRLRRDIATQALDLAQCNWTMRSLKKADEYYADKNPALTEKIVWHQIMTGRQAIVAAKGLTASLNAIPEKIRGTTSLRPEAQTPQQIGSYVLGILN